MYLKPSVRIASSIEDLLKLLSAISITFSLPSVEEHKYGIRVIELTFDTPVKMSPRNPVYKTGKDENEDFPGWYVQ